MKRAILIFVFLFGLMGLSLRPSYARSCTLIVTSTGNPGFTASDTISVSASGINLGGLTAPPHYLILVDGKVIKDLSPSQVSGGSFGPISLGQFSDGVHTLTLSGAVSLTHPSGQYKICETSFTISPSGGGPGGSLAAYDICQTDQDCLDCINGVGKYSNPGIWTAIGCIPSGNLNEFVNWFLARTIGISGGIAFLLIIFGGIKIITSGGNPEGIKSGQGMISSALAGLIFIIFSVFLLELIGVDILKLPEFGTP